MILFDIVKNKKPRKQCSLRGFGVICRLKSTRGGNRTRTTEVTGF